MYKDTTAKWHSIAIFVVAGAYGWGVRSGASAFVWRERT